MTARIDAAAVMRITATRFATITATGLTLVQFGRPEPRRTAAWCRFVALDIAPRDRFRQGPDHADVTLTVLCAVSERQTKDSAYALATVVSRVLAAFDEAHDDDSPTSDHTIDWMRPEAPFDAESEHRGIRTATLTIGGVARRATGTSIEDYL